MSDRGLREEEKIDEVLDEGIGDSKKLTIKKIGNNILGYIAASIAPLVPLLLGAGLWNVIGMILGPTMLNVFSAESGFGVVNICAVFKPTKLSSFC